MSNKAELITSHLKLVWYVLDHEFPASANDEDMYQDGCIGLIQAANSWDESKGVSFKTFAYKCIKNKMLHTINYRTRPRRALFDTVSLDSIISDTDDLSVLNSVVSENTEYFNSEEFLSLLTPNEKYVLELLQQGYNANEISRIRGTSRQTVSLIIKRMQNKWNEFYNEKV